MGKVYAPLMVNLGYITLLNFFNQLLYNYLINTTPMCSNIHLFITYVTCFGQQLQ